MRILKLAQSDNSVINCPVCCSSFIENVYRESMKGKNNLLIWISISAFCGGHFFLLLDSIIMEAVVDQPKNMSK